MRCELDAAYFHLYGIERDDVDYIMETFPIVKRRDEKQHGGYRTKRVMLDVYDAMGRAMESGEPYQTLLDPPPADPRVAPLRLCARYLFLCVALCPLRSTVARRTPNPGHPSINLILFRQLFLCVHLRNLRISLLVPPPRPHTSILPHPFDPNRGIPAPFGELMSMGAYRPVNFALSRAVVSLFGSRMSSYTQFVSGLVAGLLAFGLFGSPAVLGASGQPRPFEKETLADGVTLIVRPNPTSNVVGIEIVSRIGTRYEEPGQAGLTTLTLRTMLAGAGSLTRQSIKDWFEERGSSIDVKAHPDYSEVGTAVVAPDFPGAVRIMASLAREATLSSENVQIEQQAVLDQIRSTNQDEESEAYESLRSLLAGSSAYGRPETGYMATIIGLSQADVLREYHLLFGPRQMIVSVSGNVDPGSTMDLLRDLFGKMPDQPDPPKPQAFHPAPPERGSLVTAGYGDEAWIMVGFSMPGVRDEDYAAASVLNAVIGGANSGLVPTLLRDKGGVYDSGSFLQPFGPETHIVAYVRAEPLLWDDQAQKMQPVVDEFQKDLAAVFAGVCEKGITPDQLKMGQEFVRGSYLRAHEHNKSCAGYLGWYEALGLGADFDRHFLDQLHKVTLDQVNRVARERFQAALGVTVIMFPRASAGDAQ